MDGLTAILAARIRAAGPIRLDEFMGLALTHPQHGYYTGREVLGAAGDFTTAPEISQMFGELLGLALAAAWTQQGAPGRIVLAEAGPGRGTLMADLLRATRAVPGFHDALSLQLVEVSPRLRARQAEALADHAPTWHADLDALPEGPLYLVANEYFDALPIRQFRREGAGWRERMVTLGEGGGLAFAWSPPAPVAPLDHRRDDTHDGDIVELCAQACADAGRIGARIARHGGAALIVDYGGGPSLGDTFQAVFGHAPADPLADPGAADLTAHVDFAALAAAARAAGAAVAPPVAQGVFLERLGITPRAQALARGLTGAALDAHVAAHRRLTHPEEMGNLFQVMGLHPRNTPPPPGLAA